MKRLRFAKMSGAGNDFVLVDAADFRGTLPAPAALARLLCDRRSSIGADGLLIVRRKGRLGLPALDYYNADGSEAFCANGSRCAAWFVHQKKWAGRRLAFGSIEGTIRAEIAGKEVVRIQMPTVRDIRLNLRLAAAGRRWTAHAINTGVPHAVVEVKNLDQFPVFEMGRALRRHRAFAPAGANVDFISIAPRSSKTTRGPLVRLRTYERGVEDETLACGTGATASAICAHLLEGLRSPVQLLTRGGDALSVRFRVDRGRFEDVWLEGPARTTFTGEVTL